MTAVNVGLGLAGVVQLQQLGGGGYGDVYQGIRADTGERVVVKFLREPHDPEARRGFAREVRILSKGIAGMVPVLWSDLSADRPYYVMPHYAQGSLSAFIGRLSVEQILAIGLEIAGVLERMHAQTMSHGDIKPDNILVAADGRIFVGDPLGNGWGCTVLFAAHQGGTPGYCAPEVLAGSAISKAGDVFSLGATLHHLATGRKPEIGSSFALDSRLNVPRNLREVVTLATQREPARRPSAKDIGRMLRGESWSAITTERNWNVALGIGAVVLFAAALSDAA